MMHNAIQENCLKGEVNHNHPLSKCYSRMLMQFQTPFLPYAELAHASLCPQHTPWSWQSLHSLHHSEEKNPTIHKKIKSSTTKRKWLPNWWFMLLPVGIIMFMLTITSIATKSLTFPLQVKFKCRLIFKYWVTSTLAWLTKVKNVRPFQNSNSP